MFYPTLLLAGFLAAVLITIQVFRWILNREQEQLRHQNFDLEVTEKKHKHLDIKTYEALLFNLSLAMVLGLLIGAFEWKSYQESSLKDLGMLESTEVEIIDVPITEQAPPPPPKTFTPSIVEVADAVEVENQMEVVFNTEMQEQSTVETPTKVFVAETPIPKEEVVEEIFTIVEESAAPKEGMAAFYAEMGAIVKYPAAARQAGVEGKVFVEFIINKEGKLTDAKVVKGIGFGCDEEALRILAQAKPWNPAKQRGKTVLQRMILPITFRIQQK